MTVFFSLSALRRAFSSSLTFFRNSPTSSLDSFAPLLSACSARSSRAVRFALACSRPWTCVWEAARLFSVVSSSSVSSVIVVADLAMFASSSFTWCCRGTLLDSSACDSVCARSCMLCGQWQAVGAVSTVSGSHVTRITWTDMALVCGPCAMPSGHRKGPLSIPSRRPDSPSSSPARSLHSPP